MYFAVYEASIGQGETLDKAFNELMEQGTNYATISEITFYEGKKIEVVLQQKQTLTKQTKGV